MCGIVAVLRRPSSRQPPEPGSVLAGLAQAESLLASDEAGLGSDGAGSIEQAARLLGEVDSSLRGTPGLRCLLSHPELAGQVHDGTSRIRSLLDTLESRLDRGEPEVGLAETERINAALVAARDAWWAIERDRLGMARAVAELIGEGAPSPGAAGLDGWWSIQVALASLDRLEVRGRDSAGLHVLVAAHGLDLRSPDVEAMIARRTQDPAFPSGSVRVSGGCLSFVYKAAAEIGELGDNVRVLRAAISSDPLLARALAGPEARATVIGHTRWASVGIISEPNAHPVSSEEEDRQGPYVVAALNGDVDNHAELRAEEGIVAAPEITTDAKVIPVMVSRRMAEGDDPNKAFRTTVRRFEGSVAIAVSEAATPDSVYLALRGSGQSLYVGLAEDAFVVASEPYGLVEETPRFIRMDGEATGGQVVRLHRDGAGTLEAVTRHRYDGGALPVAPGEVVTAEITTRDIDRRGFAHFLLKELYESPGSLRKTLRGRIVDDGTGNLAVRAGPGTVTPELASAFAAGSIRRVLVIGQGTAAVAGQAVAAAIACCTPDLTVAALPATELSGFALEDDMSDVVVVAISQSGTTTDTNRTVDLVRTRGAHVIAIVNRRNSDLVSKAHGVLYTSDGRDVEMSVASTKAFYSQVAAGWVLAAAMASAAGGLPDVAQGILRALRDLPAAMEQVLAQREEIGRVAAAVAPARRYWAVVGSGPDKVAASEVRIKLSELSYRSISSDATEDKKHIDLSAEPLILVCAAGLRGATADDVAKEVAIYRAHKAAPVVIVTEGEGERFRGPAGDVISVPATHPALGFVLAALVGHLFGYEAAVSIDSQALPLRAARAAIEAAASSARPDLMETLGYELQRVTQPFFAGLREGSYNGNLEAATAVQVVTLLRYVTGLVPLEVYELETGKIATPSVLIGDLLTALTEAIDELTRPVDAIKHQAKTVTVGISRSEDALLKVPLVEAALGAGAAPDTLGYKALRTLAALDEAVAEVLGYTRYRIEWNAEPGPLASVADQGGLARLLPSRTGADPRLRGTKHRAAEEREVTVGRGASDGRTFVLVPEVKGIQVIGMTLLHVRFHERLPADVFERVLRGYRTRYSALYDAVTETEPSFDESVLERLPVADVLTEPVYALAEHWRRRDT